MRRRAAFIIALVALLCALTPRARSDNGLTAEDSVKAAFLYRFASFVEWPSGAFADQNSPIRLCVIGSPGFAPLLERTVAGQQVNGRAFDVRRLSDGAAARDCHIVFVTGGLVEETLHVVYGRPVLTVTDAASSGDRGMIHFAIVQDRVRFYIDDARAAEGGLFISSRLLTLAVSVRRRAG